MLCFILKFDSTPCCCELTNLCGHHTDVVPGHLLSVQTLGGPDDPAVHANSEIQMPVFILLYEVPAVCGRYEAIAKHELLNHSASNRC